MGENGRGRRENRMEVEDEGVGILEGWRRMERGETGEGIECGRDVEVYGLWR